MDVAAKYNHNHDEPGFHDLPKREAQKILDDYRASRGAKTMRNSIRSKALATVEPVDSSNPNGEFDVILSTKARDRDGDELLPEQWAQPLPDYITFDTDHGMSVPTTVGGGRPFINDAGQLQVRGVYSSLKNAQDTRTLVNERILRNVSVAFLERPDADGKMVRELLNGSFVPIPANTEAVVLASKAASGRDSKFPYGRQVHYADPGFRNGVHRYPLRDAEEARSAWDYFHHEGDRDKYTKPQQAHIEREIEAAASEFGVHLDKSEEKRDAKQDKSVNTKSGYPNDGGVPAGSEGDSDAHSQLIHDLAVKLGARCGGDNASAGLTDGAPRYGKSVGTKDAPHADSGHTYNGALEAPNRTGSGNKVPEGDSGDSDAGHEQLQTIHDAAVRMGAACGSDYAHGNAPHDAMGSSDALDLMHGVQAVLMNHLAKSMKSAVALHNGQGVPDALNTDDGNYPHLQMIHDAAVQLGGQCQSQNPIWAEDGEVWGANSPVMSAPTSRGKSADTAASAALKWAADTAASAEDTADAIAKAKALAIGLS